MQSIWSHEPNIFGKTGKVKRKNFSAVTRKDALIRAKGKCMSCHRPLNARSTEYDHKDNNPANNSPKNCYVVCSNCHREHTVTTKRKVKGFLGETIGYKTVKKKVGYKARKRKRAKKVRKKIHSDDFFSTKGTMFDTKTRKNRNPFF